LAEFGKESFNVWVLRVHVFSLAKVTFVCAPMRL